MSQKKKRLLLDADIMAYTIAAVNQTTIDWGEGEPVVATTDQAAEDQVKVEVQSLRDLFPGCEVHACFTGTTNWRKDMCPSYKANRKGKERPLLLEYVKSLIMGSCERTLLIPPLEADDVMGLAATMTDKWDSIIVSSDKDMKTISCAKVFNPRKPEEGVVESTFQSALYNQMFQALTGDTSDGYPGLPGVGPVKAAKILEGRDDLYTAVKDAFIEKGLTSEDAMMQARLSKILDTTVWHAWCHLAETNNWRVPEPFWD